MLAGGFFFCYFYLKLWENVNCTGKFVHPLLKFEVHDIIKMDDKHTFTYVYPQSAFIFLRTDILKLLDYAEVSRNGGE